MSWPRGRPIRASSASARPDSIFITTTARARCRNGWSAPILREERAAAGVLHCFSSGRALAEVALDLGFHISISGIVTFKNAEELRSIVRDVPLDRLLV